MSLLGTIASIGSAITGVGSALVPGLGGVSQALGGIANSQSQADANKANLQIARENNEFNEKMWNKTNEYNTPAQQRMRMQQAGYNPYLVSGQISSGSATSSPTASPVAAMQSVRGGDAGMAAAKQSMDTTIMKANVATAQANAEEARAKADEAAANAANAREQTPFIGAQAAANVKSQELKNAITEQFGSERAKVDIDKVVADAAKSRADALKDSAQLPLIASQVLETYAKVNNINMSTKQMRDLLPYTQASLSAQANAANASANASNANANFTNTQNSLFPSKVYQDLSESRSRERKNNYESSGANFGVFRAPAPAQISNWFNQALHDFNPLDLMMKGFMSMPKPKSKIKKGSAIHR